METRERERMYDVIVMRKTQDVRKNNGREREREENVGIVSYICIC